MNLTNIQKNYLYNKKLLYHNKNGDQNYQSLLNLQNLQDIIELINYFYLDIKLLSEKKYFEIGYCGKDFFLNYKSDNKKEINFDNSFLSEDKLKNIINNVGSYLPILMFFDEDECITAIECVHTKYSLRVIKELFENKKLNNEEFLFIIKPIEQQINNEEGYIFLPKILFDKVGYLLNLNYKIIDEKWVKIFSNNTIDLWLLFKLLHKEASYYITKYMEILYNNQIYPPSFISKK